MENLFNDVGENLRRVRYRLAEAAVRAGRSPLAIGLMAVTKTIPPDAVNAATAQGVSLIGENRAQELLEKYDHYDKYGVSIHFIGHLQTNKVRQIIDKVDMIHSLDGEKLAAEIDAQAARVGRICDVLIEVNVGGEESKTGLPPEQVPEFAASLVQYPNLRLRGLMTVPPLGVPQTQTQRYFSHMQQLFVDIRDANLDNGNIDTLSMGMSDDFELAIAHGATIIRIGTALFGKRS